MLFNSVLPDSESCTLSLYIFFSYRSFLLRISTICVLLLSPFSKSPSILHFHTRHILHENEELDLLRSLLYPWNWDEFLKHVTCLINICWMNSNILSSAICPARIPSVLFDTFMLMIYKYTSLPQFLTGVPDWYFWTSINVLSALELRLFLLLPQHLYLIFPHLLKRNHFSPRNLVS